MRHQGYIIPSLLKTGSFWLIIFLLNITVLSSAYASGALSADTIEADAKEFMTKGDLWKFRKDLSQLSYSDVPAGLKEKLLAVKDVDGNTLAHKLMQLGLYLGYLLKITGPEILEVPNTAGVTPLQAQAGDLIQALAGVLSSLGYTHDPHHKAAIETYIRAHVTPAQILREQVTVAEKVVSGSMNPNHLATVLRLRGFLTGKEAAELKTRLSELRDPETADNLAHAIVKNAHAKYCGDYQTLQCLLDITGPEILGKTNSTGIRPFESVDPIQVMRKFTANFLQPSYQAFQKIVAPYLNPIVPEAITDTASKFITGEAGGGVFLRIINIFTLPESEMREIRDILLSLHDDQGNTLAHKLLDPAAGSDGESFAGLIKWTGPAILDMRNTAGKTPLQAYPIEGVLRSLPERPDDPNYSVFLQEITPALNKYLIPAAKEKIRTLLPEIKALKAQVENERSHYPSEAYETAYRDLNEKADFLATVCHDLPKAFEGQRLELLLDDNEQLLGLMAQTEEGRKLLTSYKVGGRESLLSYYVKEEKKLSDSVRDAETNNKFHRVQDLRNQIFALYLTNGIKVTYQDWDIDNLNSIDDVLWLPYDFDEIMAGDDSDPRVAEMRKELKAKKQFVKDYRNSKGESILHLVVKEDGYYVPRRLEKFQKLIGDDSEFLKLLDTIDPDFLVKPLDPKTKVTLLMLLALSDDPSEYQHSLAGLAARGVKVDQVDSDGHTAQRLYDLMGRYVNSLGIIVDMLETKPLTPTFWDTLVNYPYIRYMTPIHDPHQFTEIAFYITAHQTQTPAHRVFFQEDTSNANLARVLWKSFFAEMDSLDRELVGLPDRIRHMEKLQRQGRLEEYRVHELSGFRSRLKEAQEEKRSPLALRVLKATQRARGDEVVEEKIVDLSATVLSGTSSFGVNFSRKARPDEAQLMVDSIDSMVRAAERNGLTDEQIVGQFMKKPARVLDATQQEKLDNHQLTCAVLALHNFYDRTNSDKYEDDNDRIFTDIDASLAGFAKGRPVDAKARYERIMNYLPKDDEYGGMGAGMPHAAYANAHAAAAASTEDSY